MSKTPASMREFKLLILNRKGQEFTDDEVAQIREEDSFFKGLDASTEVNEEVRRHQFNQNKRGTVYDYLKMAVAIMEGPKPETKGVTRREAESFDSLMDKLWVAEDDSDDGSRPASIMLDEGEFKHLRERILAHPFPNRGRAITRFQKDVDSIPKVPMQKVDDAKNEEESESD